MNWEVRIRMARRIQRSPSLPAIRNGTLRYFYSGHPWLAADIRERGMDEVNPIWNFLDLTPQGRGDWYAKLNYHQAA